MKNQFRYGRITYISFVLLDLFCLYLANLTAVRLYLENGSMRYGYEEYHTVIIVMVIIDILVTVAFNTLKNVMRRRKRRELLESLKHIGFSFVALALFLFSTKQGAEYSRVTVYLAYGLDYVLLVTVRELWKLILKQLKKKNKNPTALLMTTDGFAKEGLDTLKKTDIEVVGILLLKDKKQEKIGDIPVVKTVEEAAAAICWEWIDSVYIYGLDFQMVPEALTSACEGMKVPIDTVDFDYKIIHVKTIHNQDPKYGSLSFLEGKRDIPFPIRRVYWITETEASLHRGFHAHKLNCQLLFCPHGKIDIILDDGNNRETIRLDEPGKGLLLMPGLWREMVWQESGSVLCVLASEYYDENEYIRDYDDFIAYKKG